MKKYKIICLLVFMIGIGAAYYSSFGGAFKQVINFIGAMIITGSLIFVDEWLTKKIFREKCNKAWVQLRLLVYIGLGILLINLKSFYTINQQWIFFAKAFGISFLILGMWKFYSFTSLHGVSHQRISGCEGTGDCLDCGRSDMCSLKIEDKIK